MNRADVAPVHGKVFPLPLFQIRPRLSWSRYSAELTDIRHNSWPMGKNGAAKFQHEVGLKRKHSGEESLAWRWREKYESPCRRLR